ncbi:MAG: hypothetical protein NVS3B1_06290 [Marmoricola sp.]
MIDLEADELALILAIRERVAAINRLSEQDAAERWEWNETHDPETEPYSALSIEGSSGGKAYSACAEALADAALDAFNLVAKTLGVTGFQASYAELQFLVRSRQIKGPWGIYTMADALYPQYDLFRRLEDMRQSDDTVKWLGDCAEYALAENNLAAPVVIEHWRWLVAQRDERGL